METFKDMRFTLKESKDRLIDKTNLTPEQKDEAKAFFNKYPSYEKEIDWNKVKSLTWKDFEDLMNEVESRRLPKEGIEDLTEGEDYVTLKSPTDSIQAYAILNHRASVAIASNNTEPKVWTKLPGWYKEGNVVDDYPYDKKRNLYGGAKWCTAMHHTDNFFKDYTKNNGILVYYIWEYKNKFAVLYRKTDYDVGIVGVWDEADNELYVKDTANEIMKLNGELLVKLIKERYSKEGNSEERRNAVDEWGEDLVGAFEEFWDSDDPAPYGNLGDFYITYARDSEELYMNIDTYVDRGFLHYVCDLKAVGRNLWRDEKQDVSEEELKEIYPQYWNDIINGWDVDYEELAISTIKNIFSIRISMQLSELRDNYRFIYDAIDFDVLAESDGYELYNGYWFSSY